MSLVNIEVIPVGTRVYHLGAFVKGLLEGKNEYYVIDKITLVAGDILYTLKNPRNDKIFGKDIPTKYICEIDEIQNVIVRLVEHRSEAIPAGGR